MDKSVSPSRRSGGRLRFTVGSTASLKMFVLTTIENRRHLTLSKSFTASTNTDRITETHPCPSEDIERQELRQQLREAVKHLTPTHKHVFLLHYAHEMPVKVIATLLKRSEGTIKTHLRNARLQLQEYLTPYLENRPIPWLT